MEWAAGIKLVVFLTLIVNVFCAVGITTESVASGHLVGLLVYLVKVSALAVVIGVIESMFAKLRLFSCAGNVGSGVHSGAAGTGVLYTLKG